MSGKFELPNFLGNGNVKFASEKTDDIDQMDVDELLALKDKIEAKLPMRALKAMNLEEELVTQYMRVKALQSRVMEAEDIPANQIAQCAGQVASTLQALVKMQTEWYNAERFKKLEGLMIKHMRTLPQGAAEAFLDEYERLAADE